MEWTPRIGDHCHRLGKGIIMELRSKGTQVRTLIVINDAPYGSERCYNALRLSHALMKQVGAELDVFLIADAVSAARKGQKTPEGYYNIELMLKRVVRGNGRVLLCGTCIEARGLGMDDMLEGASVSNMAELADCIAAADRVLTF